MFGHFDMVRHPEVGLGLLLVTVVLTATAIAPAATADDIALVVGIALVVVFADLQVGKYVPWSLQPKHAQIYECVFRYVYDTKMDGWRDICQNSFRLDIQLMERSLLRCCGV